ncbi:MAG TPA: polyprenyl synthetase family protein [Fimbriimonadaceae bacterium]|nr:polyprenyl synthetase family protein [Fimbriimonadaceae bacterium]
MSSLFQTVKEQSALASLGEVVAQVEEVLRKEARSPVESVQGGTEQTLLAGGKRLRPSLAVLSARATGLTYDHVSLVHVAAALEMVHMATLVHDDVIDGADTRRGSRTASAIYGNTAAVLSGDVLLAKAMRLLADHSDIETIQMVSRAVVEMAEGEVRELEVRGDIGLSLEEHYQVLRMKTAAFIECCARVGAHHARAPRELQDALGDYAHNLGLAFQVVDDLLDFRGDRAKTGKPTATDFRDGQATLPLIHLMPLLDESQAEFVSEKFGNGVTDEDIEIVVGWMRSQGTFDAAQGEAERLAACAVRALDALPPSADRDLLAAVAEFVVEREA